MSAARRGVLIAFEGAEGVGKSTQLARLRERLAAAGVRHLAVREPGQTSLGNEIRRIVLDSDHPITAAAEALLFMAARAQLVAQDMRPALEAGDVVLADRFFLSTYAYQSAGRGLPLADVVAANRLATGGLVPDLTFLLWLTPAAAAARGAEPDRFEAEGRELQEAVLAGYERLAEAEPERWRRIDAGRPVEEVHRDVLGCVQEARAGAPA